MTSDEQHPQQQKSNGDNTNAKPSQASGSTNKGQLMTLERNIFIAITVIASITLSISIILFVQSYITYRASVRVLGYISAIFSVAGLFTLSLMPKLALSEPKRIRLIAVFAISIISFMFLFQLLLIIDKLERGWWVYFYGVFMLTSFIIFPFSQSIDRDKKLSQILDLISLILMLVAFCSVCVDIFGFF